ncbi:MAG TPA: NAD(P)-dependent oxidoreductase [Terriglobales bacterium]|nr:NAD(P)-dependent oxidoreductase [Terriglobales bacterium]
MEQIGFIGLGIMGSGMASRLLKAGYPVKVYNRTLSRAAPLQNMDAHVAATPAEAARASDVVISMVADDAASRSVWLGENGILSSIKPGAVALECSTLSPKWIRELAQAAKERGCEFLDAPVTGSKSQATAGELQFLIGGHAAAVERIRPVLSVMSRNVIHLGDNGSGALLKLINNYLCGVQVASLAEALAAIEHSGLNRERALEMLNKGAPGSPLINALSARMVSRSYDVNFVLHLMEKDLTYAISEARNHGVQFETGRAALKLFELARARGWGEQDFSAVVEALR